MSKNSSDRKPQLV